MGAAELALAHRENAMTLRLVAASALATLAVLHPAAAAAQDQTYVAGSVGYTIANDFQTDIGVEASIKNGYSVAGAVGRSFGPIRGEIEGSYRSSSVDEARGLGLVVEGNGRVSALSAMANIYFDPALQLGPVKPYVGAGAGISRFRARRVEAVGLRGIPPVSGSETGFAWQLMAGVGVGVAEGTTVTAGYRYFATPGIEATVAPLGSVEVEGLGLHVVEVGVRLSF